MTTYRYAVRAGRLLLDALLPPQCLTCDAVVADQGQLCAACFGMIGFITEPCCAACGAPFTHTAQAGPDHLCPTCTDTRPDWGRARGALRYDEHSRPILLGFKHGDRTEYATPLARMMARAGAALLREADLLVPVPLHRGRLIARRYNQSVLLARALGKLACRPMLPDGLRRIRATAMLGELSAEARAATVSGAFTVPPRRLAAITGRRILLIDDVLTSGATAAACTRALLAAGALRVDVLVAARVPDPRLA
jgi:ComF family protein